MWVRVLNAVAAYPMIALLSAILFTTPVSAPAVETRCAVLEVFLRGDADRSKDAREHIEKTYGQRPGLTVVYRDVAAKEAELERFYKIADHFKVAEPGLPAFYVSGKFEYGWDAATSPAKIDELLTVEVFVRQGCPRCAAAKPVIFNQLAPRYPGYKFVEKDLVTSTEAQRRLNEVSARYRAAATSVPALHMCGRLMVGFFDPNTSFKQWDDVLKAVTVDCPAKTSQRVRRPRLPLASIGLFSQAMFAVEPVEALKPELPELPDLPPPSVELPLPPETDTTTNVAAIDAPPPRPRRSLPPELPPETSPGELPELPSDADLASPAMPDVVPLPLIGDVNWKSWGLPAFTIMVGLVDGFNPCAMWVLLFLLSLLVNLKDRLKILAVAGTFVFISGAAYFCFMAAWLNVFQLIGLLRPAQYALGILGITVGAIHVKDFFAFKKGVSLSIPESAKPKLYERMRKIVMAESLLGAIVGASVLAVLVNIVELLCTAGLPAMYTGVLSMQNYPAWQNYAYLLLYNAAYMFDDSLMVGVVVATLGKHRLQEQGGRWLKLISGIAILAIGITMLFKPEWLV
ncbi:hypothetical protein GC163_00285 [bacterium]|nr:hypothetical protein [bacterium]